MKSPRINPALAPITGNIISASNGNAALIKDVPASEMSLLNPKDRRPTLKLMAAPVPLHSAIICAVFINLILDEMTPIESKNLIITIDPKIAGKIVTLITVKLNTPMTLSAAKVASDPVAMSIKPASETKTIPPR
ncbi:hypothetical protein [Kocuria tytonicola]|uniref:hypothetical protein n=1 Tax=Kocuria tytonicola TaxID=2055946 RepID=UPI000F51A6F9|nr:hypothetical protein [Kocuria tytonicola]